MLERTFIHISGVGDATERSLWQQGILTWQDALHCSGPLPGRCSLDELSAAVEESVAHLQARDAHYFHLRVPARERWRLFREFVGNAVCLDIETTGLSYGLGRITVIGLYDGREYKAFIRGHNLHQFAPEIRRYSLIITYNGLRFDLPFIEAEMGPVVAGLAHLDIMYPLRRLGFRGGLKSVEQQTGLARPSALQGLNGYDAVLLWRMYERGYREALDTLVRYNAEDVAGLFSLATLTYNTSALMLPCNAPVVPLPPRPVLNLPYDLEIVERLRLRAST